MAAMCGRCARKLQHLRIPWQRSLRSLCTASSTSSEEVDDERDVNSLFTSPTKRDPLAVLRALASTVQLNPGLPNPEFFEDPFLMPVAKYRQAECLLAKKSGQEAAMYVISECPEIFPLRKPNPMWETEDVAIDIADVQTEEQLKCFIKTRNAKSAVQAYERLKEQGVEVSLETQNELLDLAAQHLGQISVEEALEPVETGSSFLTIETKQEKPDADDGDSNSDSDSVDEGFDDEEREEDNNYYNPVRNRWKKGNYAEKMFESMTIKDGCTYETMVLGLVKHNSGSEAYEMFKEIRTTGHQVSVMTYYLMFLGIANCDDVESKWEKAQHLVKLMGEEPVVLPNLKIFNSLLKIAAVSSVEDKSCTQLALSLLREMLAIGIEPSLESFNQVLRAEYRPVWEDRRRGKSTTEYKAKAFGDPLVLDMVISHLESLPKLPPLSDPRDTNFFHSAMSAAFVCVDANVAIRIYNLSKKQNNAVFLGKKQPAFCAAFLVTLAGADYHLPLLFDYYKEIVPEKLRPRDYVYSSLFNLASRTKTPEIVPKLYDEMRMNKVPLTRNLATAVFRALSVTGKPEDRKVHLDIMVDVLHWMKIFKLKPTPFVITTAITMYCLNGKLLEAWRMLDMFKENKHVPSYSALFRILMLAVEQMDKFKVVRCFEMLSEFGYSVGIKRRKQFFEEANIPRSEAKRLDDLFKDIEVLDARRRKYDKVRYENAVYPKASDFPWDSTETQ